MLPVDNLGAGSDASGLSRRTVLRNAVAASALGTVGAAGGMGTAAGEDIEFEETEWGYKRTDFEFDTSREWPTILRKEGYAGASRPAPNAYLRMSDDVLIALRITYGHGPDGNYAEVTASIRGTECSGGNFNLYDRRHAWDGHEIIEWVAGQPWSNGKVGMRGCSFSAQTAFLVASTQPPSLEALFFGGLHADIYRDLIYPGGVQNTLFPLAWYLYGPHRAPESSWDGPIPDDEICTRHQTNRYGADDRPNNTEYLKNFFLDRTYNDWWDEHAAMAYADRIAVPYYQYHMWNDQETGPRASVLFDAVDPEPRTVRVRKRSAGAGRPPVFERREVIPKKLVASTGSHCSRGFESHNRAAWFDIWLRDEPDSEGLFEHRVENYFETVDIRDGDYTTVKRGDAWPFADTEWRDLYLRPDGALEGTEPQAADASSVYLSGVPRENWFHWAPDATDAPRSIRGLPDSVGFETDPLEEDVVVAGPILADLYGTLSGTDTEFFVSVNDVTPDGRLAYVQRGLLRAQMRAIDEDRSYYTDDGRMYQPWRPYTNPQRVDPGSTERYRIEVFPVGHVFRAGHRIRVQIHTPPVVDALNGYTPEREPGVVAIHHDSTHPSLVRLPVVEPDEAVGDPPRACGVPGGFPCSDPVTDERTLRQSVEHADQLDVDEALEDHDLDAFEGSVVDRLDTDTGATTLFD